MVSAGQNDPPGRGQVDQLTYTHKNRPHPGSRAKYHTCDLVPRPLSGWTKVPQSRLLASRSSSTDPLRKQCHPLSIQYTGGLRCCGQTEYEVIRLRNYFIQAVRREQSILLRKIVRFRPRISPQSGDRGSEGFHQPADVAPDMPESQHCDPGSLQKP